MIPKMRNGIRSSERSNITGGKAAVKTPANKDEKRNCWGDLSRVLNCMGSVFSLSGSDTSTIEAISLAQKDHQARLIGPHPVKKELDQVRYNWRRISKD